MKCTEWSSLKYCIRYLLLCNKLYPNLLASNNKCLFLRIRNRGSASRRWGWGAGGAGGRGGSDSGSLLKSNVGQSCNFMTVQLGKDVLPLYPCWQAPFLAGDWLITSSLHYSGLCYRLPERPHDVAAGFPLSEWSQRQSMCSQEKSCNLFNNLL